MNNSKRFANILELSYASLISPNVVSNFSFDNSLLPTELTCLFEVENKDKIQFQIVNRIHGKNDIFVDISILYRNEIFESMLENIGNEIGYRFLSGFTQYGCYTDGLRSDSEVIPIENWYRGFRNRIRYDNSLTNKEIANLIYKDYYLYSLDYIAPLLLDIDLLDSIVNYNFHNKIPYREFRFAHVVSDYWDQILLGLLIKITKNDISSSFIDYVSDFLVNTENEYTDMFNNDSIMKLEDGTFMDQIFDAIMLVKYLGFENKVYWFKRNRF